MENKDGMNYKHVKKGDIKLEVGDRIIKQDNMPHSIEKVRSIVVCRKCQLYTRFTLCKV